MGTDLNIVQLWIKNCAFIAFVDVVGQTVRGKSPTEKSTLENLSLRLPGSCMDSAEERSFTLGVLLASGQVLQSNLTTAFATLVRCVCVVTDAQQAFVARYLFIVL